MTWDVVYAGMRPGGRAGWLVRLAQGWRFSDQMAPAPMEHAGHGAYSVLMLKESDHGCGVQGRDAEAAAG